MEANKKASPTINKNRTLVQKRSVGSIFNSIVNLSLNSSNGKHKEEISAKNGNSVANMKPNQYSPAPKNSNSQLKTASPHQTITQKPKWEKSSQDILLNSLPKSKSYSMVPLQNSNNSSPSAVLPPRPNDNLQKSKTHYRSLVLTHQPVIQQSTSSISPITLEKNLQAMLSLTTTAEIHGNIHSSDIDYKFPLYSSGIGQHQHNSIHRRSKSKSSISLDVDKSFAKNHDQTTPDWISEIFVLAKRGKLNELKEAVLGLEATLIRHLVDSKGNTLLHVAAHRDQLETLQWIYALLDSHGLSEAALNDTNRDGRTVLLAALKSRQLKCFQWLVRNTNCGVSLIPKDGKNSLLHCAASYGNSVASTWLTNQLCLVNVSVDIRNASGVTPLHLAAQNGHLFSAHQLITAGADPTCQTDAGSRALDFAIRHRHLECANYLMMAEAAASLGIDHEKLLQQLTSLRQAYQLLQNHFREILEVGKWLVQDRSDMIKTFARRSQKESSSPNSNSLDGTLLFVSCSSNGIRFSEMERKLTMGEQVWKELSKQSLKPNDSYGERRLNGVFELSQTALNLLNREPLPPTILTPNILQERLADLESRRDKNFVAAAAEPLTGNSSSSSSGTSDDDDDDEENMPEEETKGNLHQNEKDEIQKDFLTDQIHFLQHQPSKVYPSIHPRHGHIPITITDSQVSKITRLPPWLLPPDEFILTNNLDAFSPDHNRSRAIQKSTLRDFPNVDLPRESPPAPYSLGSFPQESESKAEDLSSAISVSSRCESLEYKMNRMAFNHEQILPSSSPSASVAVLEVIEPSENKKIYSTPDQIRAMRRSTITSQEHNGCNQDEKEIYEGIKRDPFNEFLEIEDTKVPIPSSSGVSALNNIPLASSRSPLSVPPSPIEYRIKSSPSHVLNVSSLPESNDKSVWSGKSQDFQSFSISIPSSSFPLNTLMILPVKGPEDGTRSKDDTTTLFQKGSHSFSDQEGKYPPGELYFENSNNESERITSPTPSETSKTESATEDRMFQCQSPEDDKDVHSSAKTGDLLSEKILLEESLQVKELQLQGTNDFCTSQEEQIEESQACGENNKGYGVALGSKKRKNIQSFGQYHHHHKLSSHIRSSESKSRASSRPWYEVEGSDEDEEDLFCVLGSRPSCSSSQTSTSAGSNQPEKEACLKDQNDDTILSGSHHHKCDPENCPNFV